MSSVLPFITVSAFHWFVCLIKQVAEAYLQGAEYQICCIFNLKQSGNMMYSQLSYCFALLFFEMSHKCYMKRLVETFP